MNAEEIKNKINEILSKPYARRLIPDETGGYTASIQEFPGCFAEGETPQDAIENLNKAAESWVEVALLNGYEIKEPTAYYGYSGKIALRVPRGLHKQIAELSELEDTSINQLIVTALSEYVGCKNTYNLITKSIQEKLFPKANELNKSIQTTLFSFNRNISFTRDPIEIGKRKPTSVARIHWDLSLENFRHSCARLKKVEPYSNSLPKAANDDSLEYTI